MTKRHRNDEGQQPRGILERVLFSFMGPPQLGANAPRAGFTPDPQAELCRKCGQRWDAHERVHTGTMTYRRCPADGD